MKTYNIIDNIDLIIPDSPVGVTVSGGADSAILLYFILKMTSNPVYIFSVVNQFKLGTNAKCSIDVVSKCAELTGNYNFTHILEYTPMQTKENLFNTPRKFLKNGSISYLYTGVTKNPPDNVTETFKRQTSESVHRDPSVTRTEIHENFIMPWTNVDKQTVRRIYENYNLLESLFPLTRSCEWSTNMKNVENPGTGHCGECWWCEERLWGFGKL